MNSQKYKNETVETSYNFSSRKSTQYQKKVAFFSREIIDIYMFLGLVEATIEDLAIPKTKVYHGIKNASFEEVGEI